MVRRTPVSITTGDFNEDFLPDMVVMAASDEAELVHMVATAAAIDDGPCAFRYPRGEGVGVDMPEEGVPLEIGKGRIVKEGTKVALLSFGARLQHCLAAADQLDGHGLSTTVADARFAKPLDTDLIARLMREHEVLITIEEGSIGGFGSHVLHFLASADLLRGGKIVRPMFLPDRFVGHGAPKEQYNEAALETDHIVAEVFQALSHDSKVLELKAKA